MTLMETRVHRVDQDAVRGHNGAETETRNVASSQRVHGESG